MKKTIVAIAMKAEIEPSVMQNLQEKYPNIEFIHTGVGKVKATFALTDKINEIKNKGDEVSSIINLGTCGGRGLKVGEVVYCNKFFQKDMDISALGLKTGFDLNTNYGFRGCETKEDEYGEYITHKNLNLPFSNVICATADSFTNDLEPKKPEQAVSVEEMEAYALALVCKQKGIDFVAIKYVSNKLGAETNLKEQGEDFDKDVKEKQAETKLVSALETTMKKIELENKQNEFSLFNMLYNPEEQSVVQSLNTIKTNNELNAKTQKTQGISM